MAARCICVLQLCHPNRIARAHLVHAFVLRCFEFEKRNSGLISQDFIFSFFAFVSTFMRKMFCKYDSRKEKEKRVGFPRYSLLPLCFHFSSVSSGYQAHLELKFTCICEVSYKMKQGPSPSNSLTEWGRGGGVGRGKRRTGPCLFCLRSALVCRLFSLNEFFSYNYLWGVQFLLSWILEPGTAPEVVTEC